MDFFLEKENIQKLNVITHLELCAAKMAPISEMVTNLNMSEFLIIKAINGVIADIETFNISELKVILQDKKVSLHISETGSLQILRWHYLQQSIHFKLFHTIFMHTATSLEKFAEEHFISFSKAYLLKTQLEEYLNKYEIKISSELTFIGDEKKIRMLLFNFYFVRFSGLTFPFTSGIKELANKLSLQIKENLRIQISETQSLKLLFFSAVTFQRLHHQASLSIATQQKFTVPQTESILASLQNFFTAYTTLSDELISNEIQFILAFLISEDFIAFNKEQLHFETDEIIVQATSVTNLFMEQMTTYFKKDLPKNNYYHVEQEIFRIHWQIFYFELIETDTFLSNDCQFIKESYPDFYHFVTSFIDILQKDLEDFKDYIIPYLFNKYHFALIKWVPNFYVTDPIYVCIDFSFGKTYNHFISKNIESFQFLNIQIENFMSDKTDLYLSNLHIPNMTCESLIWSAPPSASDWELFGNKIVAIKNKKRGGAEYA